MSFQGDVTVGVFESGPAKLQLENNLYDEFIHVLEGTLILTDQTGVAHEFAPGDSLVMPKGFTGTWEMVGETFRELIVIERKAHEEDMAAP